MAQILHNIWLDNVTNLRHYIFCDLLSKTRRHNATSLFIGWYLVILCWQHFLAVQNSAVWKVKKCIRMEITVLKIVIWWGKMSILCYSVIEGRVQDVHIYINMTAPPIKGLSFGADSMCQQCRLRSDCSSRNILIRVYTICHPIFIFWLHCCMLKPQISNYQTSTVIILNVPLFRIFTVNSVRYHS